MIWRFFFLIFATNQLFGQHLENTKIDGYRGIWFELNQKYQFGDKYSGPLGTYTAKHRPLAIYSPEAHKTFFVYGGTTDSVSRHLLCMIGEYDHNTQLVSKPTVVCDKMGVDDPHDNPSLLIDEDGYIWVYISGRGRSRPGFKYRSRYPYNIDFFEKIFQEEMTYPQPHYSAHGHFHFYTKYTGIRQMYFKFSKDGFDWSNEQLLAAIPSQAGSNSGHYQVSDQFQNKIQATFFNRHPDGNVDLRTDLYYVQTSDFGKTWQSIKGDTLSLPIEEMDSPAMVKNYSTIGKNVYLKDMAFDSLGYPICLYITSNGHIPGPSNAPYEWFIISWTGKQWVASKVTESDHNYDMGSLFLIGTEWAVVIPSGISMEKWAVGGVLEKYESHDQGKTWKKTFSRSDKSGLNYAYIRKPLNNKSPFDFFFASGKSHEFSRSELLFGDLEGNIWKLPYHMKASKEHPETVFKK